MKTKVLSTFYQRKVKESFSELFPTDYTEDLTVRILVVGAVFLIISIWLVAVFNFRQTSYSVPLRYNSFLGVTELGPWYKLYRAPLFVFGVSLLNIFLSAITYKKDKMIGYIFLGINIFNAIMVLAVVINLSLLLRS